MALTGEDLDDILAEHGGLGEFETDDDPNIERWLFPRYPGAENTGTCDAKAKTHKGTHDQTKACKNFAPDMGGMYMSRPGIGGYDTDVETVAAWLEAPRTVVGAVLLLGEPGTGKTALVEAAVTHLNRRLATHLCTPDDTRESLFHRFVGEGNGENGTPFVKAALAKAAAEGWVFYADEFMLTPDGVKPIYYQCADGRRFLSGANVDGSDVEIHPDFRLILSSNPQVRGASLPEPVASRCASTTLTVETTPAMLAALGIRDSIIAVWKTLGDQELFQPQIREVRLADYWFDHSVEQAISALIPEHAPESQREAIRDICVSHLGGDIRADGRLVVG